MFKSVDVEEISIIVEVFLSIMIGDSLSVIGEDVIIIDIEDIVVFMLMFGNGVVVVVVIGVFVYMF